MNGSHFLFQLNDIAMTGAVSVFQCDYETTQQLIVFIQSRAEHTRAVLRAIKHVDFVSVKIADWNFTQ